MTDNKFSYKIKKYFNIEKFEMALKIKWTPWFYVSMQRRLEVVSVAFLIFCGVFLAPLCSLLIIYILYAGNIYLRAICIIYLAFVYYDRGSCDRGGRGNGYAIVRDFCAWKNCLKYFPIDVIKTAELPPDRNYLICYFPHGIFCFGPGLTMSSSSSKWFKLFPGLRPKLVTLRLILTSVVWRELLLGMGCTSSAASSLTTLLNQSNDPKDESNRDGFTGNALGLIVGGAEESFYTQKDSYKCVLKNRKGFVKIALRTGSSLVPAISFGENNVYDLIEPGPLLLKFQHLIKRLTTFAPLFINGRGFLQYNFGLIPKRHPINVVIGAPIHVDRIPEPTVDDIEKVHKLFCSELEKLFENHKRKYVENAENVKLEII